MWSLTADRMTANDCDGGTEELQEKQVNPRATDIHVSQFGLVWLPYIEDADGRLRPS